VPTGLVSPSQTNTSVNLSWSAVTAPANCAVTYRVYSRGIQLLLGLTSTSTTISGLTTGTSYTFTVAAADSAGLSAQSAPLVVKAQAPATCAAAPAVPTGLASASQTSSSVNLSWNAVSAPANCAVTYNVYQNGNKVLTVPTTSAVISGLSAATSYAFTVASVDAFGVSAPSTVLNVATQAGSYTAAQVLAGVQAHMTAAVQVNSKPHINTMTRAQNVNVYQVASGIYAYASGMAIDTDGSDADPDPDHQGQTTWEDANGKALGAHHVPYYVLGDYCYEQTSPCPHFFYGEHNITGLQFALMFYNGKCIGAVFGDTQGDSVTPTSDNDSRELGEASVEAAVLLGIPSSGTTGGVDSGVTVVIFSGPQWVVSGTNATLNDAAQALVNQALNSLGSKLGL